MGNRVIYTCDRCGVETASYLDLKEYILPIWPTANNDLRVDLCVRCRNELNELLRKYYMRPDESAENVEQPLPDEVIYGWKSRLEDANLDILELTDENNLLKSDIEELQRRIKALRDENTDLSIDTEELEEELERLRDVKDKLFEANFVLTARLRELGVEVGDMEGAYE